MRRGPTIEILGGGPAGLYTAILVRRLMPHASVRVTEQNPRGATFGFGVVLSDRALEFLEADDPETHAAIAPAMERWRDMVLEHPRGAVTIDGVGFSAIGRLDLIDILCARAEALGATVRFSHPIRHLDELDGDLVVGADGLASLVRRSEEAAFAPHLEHFDNHFAWFGTRRPFRALTQTFVRTAHGAFNAHHYRYAPAMSTFIVECSPDTFERYRFADMNEAQSAAACAEIFADVLEGAPLVTHRSHWRRFPRLWCERWWAGNRVLVGDAAHTAHFSIGSGTRLAMEDALALVTSLARIDDLQDALAAYESSRRPVVHKIVTAANTSGDWYETFAERMNAQPLDFAFDYITRSGRVDMERLRRLAPRFMARYEADKAAEASTVTDPVAPNVPGSIEIGFDRTLHPNCSAVLWDNLARNPDTLAVTGPAGSLTYRALCARAARWGHAFKRAGLVPGSRIAFFLDDTPAYPAAFFGAVRAGFVPVLLNTRTRSELLSYFLVDSGATLAVCEASLASIFAAGALQGTKVDRVIVVNGTDAVSDAIVESAFVDGEPDALDSAGTGPEDMAFWMYSSGSTGRPKGIVHLHHDMAYTHRSYGAHVLRLASGDRCFSVPKIFFAYGFGNSLTFPFSVGATTVLMPGRPEPGAVLDVIERFRPTVLFGLPTLYTALCHAEGVRGRDLGTLRLSISAAEVLSEEIYSGWKALTGHGPTEGLGSTEMLHIYLSNRIDDHRLGAAGARVPGYEVKLVTPEGRLARPGEAGVMHVRGDSSAPCYWQKPEKTRKTMRGEWIDTGDRFVERDGYYYFQGRTDDLIRISGQWVWPLEVEHCLNEHPQVRECTVLAHELPDRRMTLRAVVCLRDSAHASDATRVHLQQYVKERLLPHKSPRIVEFVTDLPKTGTGKIDRQALRRADGEERRSSGAEAAPTSAPLGGR